MLVFQRKWGPEADRTGHSDIIIGEGKNKVVVRVVSNRDGKLRIGVEAPLDVPVHRGEIFRKIHGEEA